MLMERIKVSDRTHVTHERFSLKLKIIQIIGIEY